MPLIRHTAITTTTITAQTLRRCFHEVHRNTLQGSGPPRSKNIATKNHPPENTLFVMGDFLDKHTVDRDQRNLFRTVHCQIPLIQQFIKITLQTSVHLFGAEAKSLLHTQLTIPVNPRTQARCPEQGLRHVVLTNTPVHRGNFCNMIARRHHKQEQREGQHGKKAQNNASTIFEKVSPVFGSSPPFPWS